MAEVGSLWVRLLGNTKGFEDAMKGVSKTLAATGERMQAVGTGMSKSVTLPIMAVGTAAIAAATSVEGAMATIRAGTGATGDNLAALGEDFRAVFKKVPENAQQVSTAIADLNTRLGLTGEPLRQLSEQLLDLAGLTGTQIGPLIASTTRVFGDWSVATAEQAKTLDLLFKVSQATGIGVDKLANSLVQFGAPLRQMGFSLTESAALMGKWEKEGVNMELVLGSLRMAMGHFAKANIPMREGLDQTMARIRELGPSAEATALAMDVFGARAGPDMAAAILEGRFAVEELLAQIEASPETIKAAGEETETFAEKLAILRNNATLALEPVGTRLMEALTRVMPQLLAAANYVAALAEKFAALSPQTQTTILAVVGLVAVLGPALIVLGQVVAAIAGIVTVLGGLKIPLGKTMGFLFGTGATAAGAAAKVGILSGALTVLKTVFMAVTLKIWLILAAVAALAAGVYFLITNWTVAKAFLLQTWAAIKLRAIEIWGGLAEFFAVTVPARLGLVVEWFKALPGRIGESLAKLATETIPYWIGLGIGTLVRLTWEGLNKAVAFFRQLPGRVLEFLIQTANFIREQFGIMHATMSEVASIAANAAVEFFRQLPGRVWEFLVQVPVRIHEAGRLMFSAARSVASGVVENFMEFIVKLPGKVWDALMSLRNVIVNAATELWRAAREAASSLWRGFQQGLGIRSPSYLEQAMAQIMETSQVMLKSLEGDFRALGRLRAYPKLELAYENMPALAGTAATVASDRSRTGSITIPVYLDGHIIARAVAPHLVDDIRTKTGVKF